MAILLSNVTDALQKIIAPYIQNNFNESTPLLSNLKRNDSVTFMNDTFYAPIRTSRHGGITNLANDGNTLVTGSASIDQASIGSKTLTGTFDISKATIAATKSQKGAVENMLSFQAETLLEDFRKDVNRQYYSDGIGVISQVQGSVGAGTAAVMYPDASLDDGRSVDWYGVINNDISPTEFIQPGMVLGIGTAAADVGTVTAVSFTAGGTLGTVVMTGSPAIVANDAVYRLDGNEQGAGTAEIQGMRAALSSGTADYAGVPRSTYGWTPQLGTVSQALGLNEMQQKYLAARKFSMGKDRYAIFVNNSLFNKYGNLLTALRRTVNKTDLVGGWTGLSFDVGMGEVGVFVDYEVPDGEVMIINLDSWTVCEIEPMGWAEDTGSLNRRPDKLTYQATMSWFTNLLCRCPGANARLIRKIG